jgi:hypothetical protein
VFFDNGELLSPLGGILRINANLELPVGGEVLDLAFAQAKPHARFVICGGKLRPSNRPALMLILCSYQPVQCH